MTVRRVAAVLVEIVSWGAVSLLVTLAAARLALGDSRPALTAANALTPLLYLPAWAAALAGVLRRRRLLVAVAGSVVVVHLGFALPEVLAYRPSPRPAAGAIRMRIFDANVFEGNNRLPALATEVRRARPDLVVLQEMSASDTAVLDAHHGLDGLAFRAGVDRADPFGFSVASRFPLEDVDVRASQGLPVLVRATVVLGSVRVRLWVVHTVAPVGPGWRKWAPQMDDLRRWRAEEHGPLLVAGDFNATWGHDEFRRLLATGLSDGAAARGTPWAMTWRRGRRLPPLVRIDHVLTGGGVSVTKIRTGNGEGSDHRPVVADVTVPP